jgi:subtilase family serine protease
MFQKDATSPRRHAQLLAGALSLLLAPVLGTASCVAETGSSVDEERPGRSDADALSSIPQEPHKALCAKGAPGTAHCHAWIRTKPDGTVQPFAAPSGLTPADLQSAYNLPAGGAPGTGPTVAIVDAYDDPSAESDLAVYRAQFGLGACTTANGCFKKVGQTGSATSLPKADSGWAGEISLDLDMVSAACPSCKILLVEAKSASMADLGAAVNTAVALGASVISNSYGGSEDSSIPSTESYFNHPGVAITVSSGDNGYGVEYPASSAYVIAVGGTSLVKNTGNARGWTEGAWSGAGSGCSAYVAKPSYQKDTGCAKRAVADVSAVADPNTGVAVYDTYGGASAGATGWIVVGGTSAAAPLVASILALTGHGSADASWFYGHTGSLYDVTAGSNGSCSTKYLCTAGAGYDGPTGLGTPNGQSIASGGSTSSSSSSSSTSSSGTTSSSSSSSSSSGSTGGTCSHNECSTGAKLVSGCDACVTKICAADSYCCASSWDATCVGEVATVCGATCGGTTSSSSSSSSSSSTSSSGTTGGTCSHNDCSTGTKLVSGCNACVTKICAADPYCCSTKWDATCVSEVKTYCGGTCGN